MSVRIHVLKNFEVKIPPEACRLAVVGLVGTLLTIGVIYSRNSNLTEDVDSHSATHAFIQPKDQVQAEGRFIPTPKNTAVPEDKEQLEIANALPLPRTRPPMPGYYYELTRSQGDAEEGEYVLVEKRCIPKVDMPQPCYLPERGRQKFPLRRE